MVWLQAFWTSERSVEEVMSKEQLFEAIKITKRFMFIFEYGVVNYKDNRLA